MKKTLILSLLTGVVLTGSLYAEDAKPAPKDGPKRELTAEQKKLRQEIVAKYDANKDGKLDKDERAAISDEDKKRMEKGGLGRKRGPKKAE